MISLDVRLSGQHVGQLCHDPISHLFEFSYAPEWLASAKAFPISPCLPLWPTEGETKERHSTAVRLFFENLLPEGEALDHAAATNQVSKANLVGLLIALGKETSGALSLHVEGADPRSETVKRFLSMEELSERIRARPHKPFAVWDGKVRLSIAGYQDKIALYHEGNDWFFVEGPELASTHILKPEPVAGGLAKLTSNEFFVMRLARAIKLPVSDVELLHVPEPVLVIKRFDRRVINHGVERIHVIDGCQALGLAAGMKYERPYGDQRDVKHIRDGASLPAIFRLLDRTPFPVAQRLKFLQWVIFQILTGNTDAHAKNISFFMSEAGLMLAPAYDMVCCPPFAKAGIAETYAMAIGDAFTRGDISAYEWANMAECCKIKAPVVAKEITRMAKVIMANIQQTAEEVLAQGADKNMVASAVAWIREECVKHVELSKDIVHISHQL